MHVFADDSDTFGATGFMCLAGFIASDEQWNRFSDVWCENLAKHGLSHIHTSDFLAGEGEYAPLQWRYEKRISVLQEFMTIIRTHVECGIFSAMDAGVYRQLLVEHKKKMSAEMWLFRRVLSQSFKHMTDTGSPEAVQFWFDDSSRTSARLLSAWNEIRKNWKFAQTMLGGISFCNDKNIPPIQAADLLANSLSRTHRKGQPPWHSKSEFAPLFIDVPNRIVSTYIRGEIWEATDIEQHKAEILKAARPR